MNQPENFFRRWSRFKSRPFEAGAVAPQADVAIEPTAPAEELSALFRPDVPRDARQQALRGLFMTDHYREMDGLDVYVGDYSKPELLTAEVLEQIDHARALLNRDAPESDAAIEPVPVNADSNL
jgi:hypothetical protein